MIGRKRIENIEFCLKDCFKNNVRGDYMEMGVWRGGASIFARGVIRTYNESRRISYVCDSFSGLPPNVLKDDIDARKWDNTPLNWDNTPYLEVNIDLVIGEFSRMGLRDPNIVFAKGFFNETMKPLSRIVSHLAVLRLDCDMYESTVDVLYHMYSKISVGGYVIVDNWHGFPAKLAFEHFFKVHGISSEIIEIDNNSIYFKKSEPIKVQYWRYKRREFT